MAGLILGTIGSFFFGPLGFLAGSLIGNLLFPQKGQDGPRLQDKHLQGSQYGQMIPIVYGTMRLAGQVVWQTDLKEHKQTSGGKGGPQVTTYTYSASFAVKLCKGPMAGLLRLWANGTLIYDTSGDASVNNALVPLTVYLGSENAEPDPTMEAELGVGNVPAFRDDMALVFTDWDLSQFGNMIPQLSAEVFGFGGAIPWRVSTWTVPTTGTPVELTGAFDGQYITIGLYSPAPTTSLYNEYRYDIDGNLVDQPIANLPVTDPIDPLHGAPTTSTPFVRQSINSTICYMQAGGAGGTGIGSWYAHGVKAVGPQFNANVVKSCSIYANGYLYAAGGGSAPTFVTRWPAPDGVPSNIPDATLTLGSPYNSTGTGDGVLLTAGDDGYIYVLFQESPSGNAAMVRCNPDLTVVTHWTAADMASTVVGGGTAGNGASSFTVYQGNICFYASPAGPGPNQWVYSINNDKTFTPIGHASVPTSGGHVPLGGGYVMVSDGILSLNPPPSAITLAEIVRDLSLRAGLTTGDIDVSELTDLVPGYMVTSQADCATDIQPLRAAYYFDGVESMGVAKFVKRGHDSVVTIPDDELAAQQVGSDAPPIVQIKRAQEVDLPATVNVSYYDVDAWYQVGTQQAIRQTQLSQAVSSVQLAIAMDAKKARQVANVLLYPTWMERDSFVLHTARKYDYLEPTDVITAHGYTLRITRKSQSVGGVIEFEGVETLAALYLANPVGNSGSGTTSPPLAIALQPTDLVLLDIPLLVDTDLATGIYVAMAGRVDDTWRGAALDKSNDAGVTYATLATQSVATTMGFTSDALGDWTGGNIFDISNTLTVVVGPGGGTLESATDEAALAGANAFLIGSEIVQAVNCDLTAPSTYVLSRLLRGRRGTEWAMVNHYAGERWVELPTIDVDLAFSELGLPRLYKAVTFNDSLANTQPQTFTNTGVALRPYSVVQVNGAPIDPFDGTVQINWQRRTRVGGAWLDFNDVPLSEPFEKYVVQIWNATHTLCARIIETTSPVATYTAAQQVADFGATQETIYVTIAQLGAYQLGIQTPAAIPGLGAGTNDPLSPIPPYNSTPPPPVPPGCALPTQTDAFSWGTPVPVTNPAADNFNTWVISFTTGSSEPGAGSIVAAEYGGAPTNRTMVLSTSPCGPPLSTGASTAGTTVQIIFYMEGNPAPSVYPTLLPSTTYYVSINSDGASGMIAELHHP